MISLTSSLIEPVTPAIANSGNIVLAYASDSGSGTLFNYRHIRHVVLSPCAASMAWRTSYTG